MNITEAIEAFKLDLKQAGTSTETIKWYEWHLGAMAKALRDVRTDSISATALRNHLASYRDSGVSAFTVAGRDRAMRAFWRWLSNELDIKNPMQNIRRPRLPALEPAYADANSFIELLRACGNDYAGLRDRALLLFMSDTGARRGGIASLQIHNLHLDERLAMVTEKCKPSRPVFFTAYTQIALSRWLAVRESPRDEKHVFVSVRTGAGLNGNAINQMIERRKKAAGIKGRLNPHSHRHAVGIAFGKEGQVSVGAAVLGDTLGVFGDYYQRFDVDDLSEAYDKVMKPTRFYR